MSRWHSCARVALCLLPGCWLDGAEVEEARDRVLSDVDSDADTDTDSDTDSDSDSDTDSDTDTDTDTDSDTDSDTDADVDTDPLLSCADEFWVGLTTSGDSSGGVDGLQSILCQSSLGPEAVLQWTAPSTGCWAFSTEGSSFDTVAYVLDQCAGPELACDDDFFGFGGPSQAVTEVAAGATVLVVVDGFNVGDSGPWTVAASAVSPMPFDVDAGVGGGFGGDTTGADSSIEVPIGCVLDSGADHLTAWTAPATGSFTFSLVADFDSVLSVHDPCSGSLRVCQNVPLIGLESVTVQLSSGETVLLRVAGSFDDTGVYTVVVSTP